MPKVIIWRDGAIETEFDPGHRDWRMGRSETNDITLLDPRKSVSRFHAELREENGRWVFIDLNSQNGSWKDGQRVNRLVLEHGHEVLFGDYKLAFEDVKVAAPPPVPVAAADVTADVARRHGRRADCPRPDAADAGQGARRLRVGEPGCRRRRRSCAPAVKAKPPRKGVNPVILVLFLVAMLGAVAAVAWKLMSSQTVEPRVVQNAEPAETVPTPDAGTRTAASRRPARRPRRPCRCPGSRRLLRVTPPVTPTPPPPRRGAATDHRDRHAGAPRDQGRARARRRRVRSARHRRRRRTTRRS